MLSLQSVSQLPCSCKRLTHCFTARMLFNLQDGEDERRASNGRASTPERSRDRQTAESGTSRQGPELGPIALSFGGGGNASQDAGWHLSHFMTSTTPKAVSAQGSARCHLAT